MNNPEKGYQPDGSTQEETREHRLWREAPGVIEGARNVAEDPRLQEDDTRRKAEALWLGAATAKGFIDLNRREINRNTLESFLEDAESRGKAFIGEVQARLESSGPAPEKEWNSMIVVDAWQNAILMEELKRGKKFDEMDMLDLYLAAREVEEKVRRFVDASGESDIRKLVMFSEEKRALSSAVSDLYQEATGRGVYRTSIVRGIKNREKVEPEEIKAAVVEAMARLEEKMENKSQK